MGTVDMGTFSVCPDCYQAAAGYVSEVFENVAANSDEFTAECWLENFTTRTAGWDTLNCEGETSRHFSWQPCELCDGLAGDRYEVLAANWANA